MERLGLVALPRGRAWRPFLGPVALLLAATIAVGLIRTEFRSHKSSPTRPTAAAVHGAASQRAKTAKPKGRTFYVVRAGDTISGIAGKTRIATSTLLKLNPKVTPTALFIGEKIRLR
jgi:LysM repeat protein